ncbi:hypothetical protein AURDEDRAFT_162527 [Auricularia subglabra TFB-10046 SS5]|nr:hypothetical protein AURDEDRAFT_162527 [Auricularia subglabra TFB-10046 SS5]
MAPSGRYTIAPFRVDLSAQIPRLKAQLAATQLPAHNPIPGGEDDKWDWDAEEKRLNSYKHFTTVIDDTTVHFVHEKSGYKDAIPLIIR